MGVAFYILFLLVASPLKKEDACKTTKRDQPLLSKGPAITTGGDLDLDSFISTPEITIDASVKEVYDYGDTVTLKWSITHMDDQVQAVAFAVISVSKQERPWTPEYTSEEIQCGPLDVCSHPLPHLEPGTHDFVIDVHFSAVGLVEKKGSFTIKIPRLKIDQPDKGQQYDRNQQVVLECSIKDTNANVPVVKFSVQVSKGTEVVHENEIECVRLRDCGPRHSNLEYPVPQKILDPGQYSFVITVYFPETYKVKPIFAKGTFGAVKDPPQTATGSLIASKGKPNKEDDAKPKLPAPKMTIDNSVKRVYEEGDTITLKWSIAQTSKSLQVEKIEILVYTVERVRPVYKREAHCVGDFTQCSHEIPPKTLQPFKYDFVLDAYFSENFENALASGSFLIKNPLVTVTSPEDNQQFKYTERIVFKWSMIEKDVQVSKVTIDVYKGSDRLYTQQIDCTIEDCIEGRHQVGTIEKNDGETVKKKLVHGNYQIVIQVSYLDNDFIKHTKAAVSFRILALRLTFPVKHYQHEVGDKMGDIELKWSMSYEQHEVTDVKVTVWDLNTLKPDPNPCKNKKVLDSCTLSRVAPGKYKWMVEVTTNHAEQTKTIQDGDYFTVFQMPAPKIDKIQFKMYQYNERDKITIEWTIDDPTQIDSYKVWVYGVNVGVRKDSTESPAQEWVPFDPKCADITECTQFVLPTQDAGTYKCKVEAKSHKGNTRESPVLTIVVKNPGRQ